MVDDDAGVRESLRFLLEGEGYAVETYASGGDFLAQAMPPRIACLLVDQRMPSGAGLELIEHLRGRGISTPWLLLAGTPRPAIARRAAELGAMEALEKPLLQDELLARVSAGVA